MGNRYYCPICRNSVVVHVLKGYEDKVIVHCTKAHLKPTKMERRIEKGEK